jgi:hypothetical protein
MMNEVKKLQLKRRRLDRKDKRLQRVATLYLLTVSYSYYAKMTHISRELAERRTPEEAEQEAEKFNSLFVGNFGIEPTSMIDFLPPDSSRAVDEALCYYDCYRAMLQAADKNPLLGVSSKAVDAFCRFAEYGKGFAQLKTVGKYTYPLLLHTYIQHIIGHISTEELRRRFMWERFLEEHPDTLSASGKVYLSPISFHFVPVNLRIFVRQMRQIEEAYNEIAEKQQKKRAKQAQ